MAFLNFLTQGQPLPSTTSSLTTSQVPQYLSDYLYKLMSGAYSAAQEPYQTYEGPRIAGFTPEQLNSMEMVTGKKPSYNPPGVTPNTGAPVSGAAGAGANSTFEGSLPSVDYGTLPPEIRAITPLTSNDVGGGAATAYKPMLNAAEKTTTEAGGLSTLKTSDPYFKAASASVPSVIKDYMNPYQQNVINTMGSEAQRLLQEKILPTIGDQFIRAGQYGSSRQQEIAQRGVRDVASDLEANIGKQLASGYTTAGNMAGADLQRLASIGQATGALTGTEEANKAALAGVQAGLGQKEQALGLTGAAATETVGKEIQDMNQRNLDLAYEDFAKQNKDPMDKLSFLSSIVRGLPVGGGTTSGSTSSMGSSYSASPLASLASAGLSAAALGNLLK